MKDMEFIELRNIYDILIELADRLMAYADFCRMDADFLCARSRIGRPDRPVINNQYNCCGHPLGEDVLYKCKYLVPGQGCITRNLHCKTYLCDTARRLSDPEAVALMDRIALIKYFYYMDLFRASEEETLLGAVFPNLRKMFDAEVDGDIIRENLPPDFDPVAELNNLIIDIEAYLSKKMPEEILPA